MKKRPRNPFTEKEFKRKIREVRKRFKVSKQTPVDVVPGVRRASKKGKHGYFTNRNGVVIDNPLTYAKKGPFGCASRSLIYHNPTVAITVGLETLFGKGAGDWVLGQRAIHLLTETLVRSECGEGLTYNWAKVREWHHDPFYNKGITLALVLQNGPWRLY